MHQFIFKCVLLAPRAVADFESVGRPIGYDVFFVYIKSRRKFKDRRIQQVNEDFRNRVAKTLDGL